VRSASERQDGKRVVGIRSEKLGINYMYKKENIVMNKSKAFAIRIIKLYRYLCDTKNEYVLSKQILRSGTSIGANIKEAQSGQSRKDFKSKIYIAYKEASETEYWLELLHESDILEDNLFESLYNDNYEILSLLISITKTLNKESKK
jgi:four helix bundle protein